MNKLLFLIVFLFSVNESLNALVSSMLATEPAITKEQPVDFEGVVKYQISFKTGLQLSADYLSDLQREFGTEETYYFKQGAYRRESGDIVQLYDAETTELLQWQRRKPETQTLTINEAEAELLSFSALKGKDRIAEFKCKKALLHLSEGSLMLWYHPDLAINKATYSAHKRNYWSAIAEHTAAIPLRKELRLGDELTVVYEAVVVHRRALPAELFDGTVREEAPMLAEAITEKAAQEAELGTEELAAEPSMDKGEPVEAIQELKSEPAAAKVNDRVLLEELTGVDQATDLKELPLSEKLRESEEPVLIDHDLDEDELIETIALLDPNEVIRRELRDLYSVEMLAGLEEDVDKRNALSNVFENPSLGITVEVVHESQSFLKSIGFMDYSWDDHKLFTTDRVRRYLEDIEVTHSKIVTENGMKHQRLIIAGLTENESRVNFAIGLYETDDHFYQVNVISTEAHYLENKQLIEQIL